jgi:hypothetical protein
MNIVNRKGTANFEVKAQRPRFQTRVGSATKNAFATAAVLASLAGCGDEIKNYYYPSPDGDVCRQVPEHDALPSQLDAPVDAATDAGVADSKICGVTSSDRCERKNNRASCVLRPGESVELDGLKFIFFPENDTTLKFVIVDPKAGCGDDPADVMAAFKLQTKETGPWIQNYVGLATAYGRTYLLVVTGVYPDKTSTHISAVRAEITRIDGNVTCESLLGIASPLLKSGDSFNLTSQPLISAIRLNGVSASGGVSIDLLANSGASVKHIVIPGDSIFAFNASGIYFAVGASDVFAGQNEQSARVTLYNCL